MLWVIAILGFLAGAMAASLTLRHSWGPRRRRAKLQAWQLDQIRLLKHQANSAERSAAEAFMPGTVNIFLTQAKRLREEAKALENELDL